MSGCGENQRLCFTSRELAGFLQKPFGADDLAAKLAPVFAERDRR